MRKRPIGIFVASMALVLSLGLVGCGGSAPATDEKDTQEDVTTGQLEDSGQDATDDGLIDEEGSDAGATSDGSTDTASSEDMPDYLDVSGVDFSSPSIVIEDGDFDGMVSLVTDMSNFAVEEGTIVEVTGHVGPTEMTHSILVDSGEGTARGTNFIVVGLADDAYPPDETPIHITGVLRKGEYGYFVIIVPQELFEVL